MATGNGAYIAHKALEAALGAYSVRGYNPWKTIIPLSLRAGMDLKGADIIHTSPDYACFFMKPRVPLVVTFHNYVLDPEMRPYSSFFQNIHYKTDLRLFTRFAAAKAHTLTAVSRFTAKIAKRNLGLSRDIQVIYNGIDIKLFSPLPRNTGKEFRVLFSGNPTHRKGIQWLPAIAKQLNRNITIYFTGGLRNRKMIFSGSNIAAAGSISYRDMPSLYNSMDMVFMPTVREGFGLSVAEAMACGLPVVATDCSSIPELVINGKGGFLCKTGDVKDFARKINTLADSPELCRQMGRYNRDRIEKHFTLDKMVNAYKALFKKI